MKKQIELHEKKVEYTLKVSKRARTMRLAMYGGGDFVVTVPRFVGEQVVEQFIIRNAKWVLGKLEYFKNIPPRVLPKNNKLEFARHKGSALVLAERKMAHFNEIYQFTWGKVTIRNQKTRWGSCSKKGNINFNYKIALLPEHLTDYIIVHELCHLGEFNHSQKFWDLVERTMPNYREFRKELKGKGFGFF